MKESLVIGHNEGDCVSRLKEKLIKDQNVIFAILFGSHVRGSQHSQSDLDVALFLKDPLAGLLLLEMIHQLSEYTKKEVDIVVLNHASAFLRHQVMKYGVRLFIRDSMVYRQFREQTMTDYDTYKFVSGMNRYDR